MPGTPRLRAGSTRRMLWHRSSLARSMQSRVRCPPIRQRPPHSPPRMITVKSMKQRRTIRSYYPHPRASQQARSAPGLATFTCGQARPRARWRGSCRHVCNGTCHICAKTRPHLCRQRPAPRPLRHAARGNEMGNRNPAASNSTTMHTPGMVQHTTRTVSMCNRTSRRSSRRSAAATTGPHRCGRTSRLTARRQATCPTCPL